MTAEGNSLPGSAGTEMQLLVLVIQNVSRRPEIIPMVSTSLPFL